MWTTGANTYRKQENPFYLKVSGNPCNDHNLTLIVSKKTLSQLFLYFSAQIETENYKLTYES